MDRRGSTICCLFKPQGRSNGQRSLSSPSLIDRQCRGKKKRKSIVWPPLPGPAGVSRPSVTMTTSSLPPKGDPQRKLGQKSREQREIHPRTLETPLFHSAPLQQHLNRLGVVSRVTREGGVESGWCVNTERRVTDMATEQLLRSSEGR